MPNFIAYGALLVWPLATALMFQRLAAGRALIVAMVAGYLILPPAPARFDLPGLPDITKDFIPAMAAMAAVLVLKAPGIGFIPKSWIARILILVFVFSPVGTVLTNPEPVVQGIVTLPGLGARDALGMVLTQIFSILPFLLARHLLSAPENHRDLLVVLMVGGLAYTLPMLVEVRLSPQMNVWIYGYFQHTFDQMMRAGGYRPIVFLYHALWVAFFTMSALVAAMALWRLDDTGRLRGLALPAAVWLTLVLVLCKSYASMAYALLLVPLVVLATARMQIRLAAMMAILALAYPMSRATEVFPVQAVVETAGRIGPDRAHTLQYRFDNEEVLAARAAEKPVFGWGYWARNHIHDPRTGRIRTVTDGRWVLVLGIFGQAGFVAEFGLLALPLFALWWRRGGAAGSRWIAPIALLHGVNMVDLMPNATVTPLSWLIAGAILGEVERAPRALTAASPAAPVPPRPRLQPIRTVL